MHSPILDVHLQKYAKNRKISGNFLIIISLWTFLLTYYATLRHHEIKMDKSYV